ncbi:hypothetical protein SAMD00019534_063370 [Acytostelium subglobosum LB1]|uniref:hypothetical protein n=1 Tax=Acytostelium subglobosum LB1 TaxID=1410327 RepID=UPI000644BB85|nr:hypothetical protein SAMD00019534_063370 [Acytostelium subglobosum LB1]GAM23162.1 hypothetical protein SAMD00019534_063370 [Acytostelium subglobosum LB1]|eukprot:XP_012753611.1 hypothetical protein SAMD00019534_063370 [Acytostelium subglobosum LB1]
MDSKIIPIKDTPEYKKLTRTLEILEQQRKDRENDIEALKRLQADALADPIEFVERLIAGRVNLPTKQPIEPVPIITNLSGLFSPTTSSSPSSKSSSKSSSRSSKSTSTTTTTQTTSSSSMLSPTDTMYSPPGDTTPEKSLKRPHISDEDLSMLVDSTIKKKKKKHSTDGDGTFNLSWSTEEQSRLEQLLVKYPSEAVASHRWTKIAAELGNRTPKQVASRTQKYFVKLHKLGLPIPGKPPNQPSLFPRSTPKKSKDTGDGTPKKKTKKKKTQKKEDSTDTSKASTSKKQSSSSSVVDPSLPVHEGYKCDGCDVEPIVGTRWRCQECIELDLCDNCNNKYEEIGQHKSSHHMNSYDTVDPYYYRDDDYKFSYNGGEANYLDSNYKP